MTKAVFQYAKNQIRIDIERELQLARFNKSPSTGGGSASTGYTGSSGGSPDLSAVTPAESTPGSLHRCVNAGAGNFLAALALLCYTEWAGKVESGNSNAKANFDAFFNKLGPSYESIAKSIQAYDRLRCGLAHEFFAKTPVEIHMLSNGLTEAVSVNPDGVVVFVVELYYRDLMKGLNELEERKIW